MSIRSTFAPGDFHCQAICAGVCRGMRDDQADLVATTIRLPADWLAYLRAQQAPRESLGECIVRALRLAYGSPAPVEEQFYRAATRQRSKDPPDRERPEIAIIPPTD